MRLYNKESLTTTHLKQALSPFTNYNCFNPSHLLLNEHTLITFRSFNPKKSKPFSAYLLVISSQKELLYNLSDIFFPHTGMPTCDPKLFTIGNEAWITFNTGHFENPNKIFIAQVYPHITAPIECIYAGRSSIEKNWGFYTMDENLYCIYSLYPTIILASDRSPGKEKKIIFHNSLSAKITESNNKHLTLGTQPTPLSDNSMLIISHEKHYLSKRRLYVGRAVKINFSHENIDVDCSPTRLFHSYTSLFGSSIKHNTNLISCSYFSGATSSNGNIILGYGINDLTFSFAQLRINELFG